MIDGKLTYSAAAAAVSVIVRLVSAIVTFIVDAVITARARTLVLHF